MPRNEASQSFRLLPFYKPFWRPAITNDCIHECPIRVHVLYQIHFLLSSPAFYFLFSYNSIIDIREVFVINEVIAKVFTSKGTGHATISPMLHQSLRKIVSDTGIKYCSFWVGDDINVVVVLFIDVHEMFFVIVFETPPQPVLRNEVSA